VMRTSEQSHTRINILLVSSSIPKFVNEAAAK
jgi:hypothetical protein